jgi:hypothetical protein
MTLRHSPNSPTMSNGTAQGCWSATAWPRPVPVRWCAPWRTAPSWNVWCSAFTTERPCERKANRPPGADARAEAVKLLSDLGSEVVIDLARYGELVGATAVAAILDDAASSATEVAR